MDDKKLNASGIGAEQSVQQNQMDSPSGALTKSAQRRAIERAKQMNSGDYYNNGDKNSDDSKNYLRTRQGLQSGFFACDDEISKFVQVIAQGLKTQAAKDSSPTGDSNGHHREESRCPLFLVPVKPRHSPSVPRPPPEPPPSPTTIISASPTIIFHSPTIIFQST